MKLGIIQETKELEKPRMPFDLLALPKARP